MTEQDFTEAFFHVVCYNGYEEDIKEWARICGEQEYPFVFLYRWNLHNDPFSRSQLEVLNIILVTLFGDYGTSPRTGWIEKKQECKEFLDKIIEMCADRE